ncbi:hypothetical protein JW926_04315 [Candidatus Sumerlaeota bacterium]|nr:hypothetical protein [Candidatus Sumerlaeota bacterium]
MEEPFEKSRDLILYIFNQPDICRGFSMLPGKSIFSDEIIRFAKNTYGDNLDSLYLGFLERTPDNINALIVHSTTYTGDYTPLVKVFAENYISRKEDKKKRIENLQTILGKWKSNISQFDDVSDISFEEIRNKRREEYSKRNKPNAALDYSDKHPRAWAREQFVKGSEVLENIIKENENKK